MYTANSDNYILCKIQYIAKIFCFTSGRWKIFLLNSCNSYKYSYITWFAYAAPDRCIVFLYFRREKLKANHKPSFEIFTSESWTTLSKDGRKVKCKLKFPFPVNLDYWANWYLRKSMEDRECDRHKCPLGRAINLQVGHEDFLELQGIFRL